MSRDGALAGRVAIVTGAGRGLGRAHALLLAHEGARVVVNDTGGGIDGAGTDVHPAEEVAAEIRASGGEAVANTDDVADWNGGRRLVAAAIKAFGAVHVVVNNAGILRDRYLAGMTAREWDDVVRAHLRGHFVTMRWAAAWWREQAKAGRPVRGSVVNTTSTSGLLGNLGQTNYGSAKAAIAALTVIAAGELGRYGARVNAIAPMARTRLTESVASWQATIRAPEDPDRFDSWDPANVSPLVAWLSTEQCPATGRVFYIHGGEVRLFTPWALGNGVVHEGRWTVGELQAELGPLVSAAPATPFAGPPTQ